MTSAHHAGEKLGGRSTAQTMALMRPPLVVELHERVEAALHRPAAREVPAAKLDPPVLVQDRPLQTFDEAIGPGMAGQGARVLDAQDSARFGEGALELRAPVGDASNMLFEAGLARFVGRPTLSFGRTRCGCAFLIPGS